MKNQVYFLSIAFKWLFRLFYHSLLGDSQRPYKITRLAEVIKENGNVTPCETGFFKMLQNISVSTKLYKIGLSKNLTWYFSGKKQFILLASPRGKTYY